MKSSSRNITCALRLIFASISLFLFAGMIILSCGEGDDSFSDIKLIEKIVKEDKEQIFSSQVANDSIPAAEDTTVSKILKVDSRIGISFGRVISNIVQTPNVSLISDSLAFAAISYELDGDFRVLFSNGDGFAKPLSHTINRYVTFVKRENPFTGEPWSRVSVSAGFGYSTNSNLSLDTLLVATPTDTVFVTDPTGLVLLENKHLVLHRGDPISIFIVARNIAAPADSLFGNIVMGKNAERAGRMRLRLPNTGNHRYARTVFVGQLQPLGFNQLMIDFMSKETVFNRAAPYDSFIMLIPYRLVE